MSLWKLISTFCIVIFLATSSALAQNNLPSKNQTNIFKEIITAQITAFQNNEPDRAFSFAAPKLKNQIKSARQFMKLVERRYLPVFNPRRYKFAESKVIGKTPVQTLIVDGPEGFQWKAYYLFEQQLDDTWKISGVFLKKQKGTAI